MRRSVERAVLAGFALALFMLLCVGATAFVAAERFSFSSQQVVLSYETLFTIERLMGHLSEAESGQRGYVVLGGEEYLPSVRSAMGLLEQDLAALRELTAGNPSQQARLERLEPLVMSKIDFIEEALETRQVEGIEAATALLRTNDGLARMEAIRPVIAEMEAEEQALLAERLELVEDRESFVKGVALFGSLLAVLLVGFAARRLERDMTARLEAEAALKAAHDELDARVQERTAELATVNEQLRTEIAERERARRALEAFAARLEVSNRELQDFAYVASHDLQEPLRKIQAFGDRLKLRHGDKLGPQGIDYLERMQNAASRMQELLSDLLDFSRVTTKAQPFVPVDLTQVTREVVSDLEGRILQEGGCVVVEELPRIEADPLQMRLLMQNLISNGLKFHGEAPPLVTVRAEETSRGQEPSESVVRLVVEDNGIGFDEKYLDRIFTPFQRLHGRGEYEGSGMGLAICRKIVERHGGQITARSKPGEGAAFLVTLPAQQLNGGDSQ